MWNQKEWRREYHAKHKAEENERSRMWSHEHPNLRSDAQKRHYTKLKNKFLEMYGTRCSCCGETIVEFLTVEHINGQTKSNRETTHAALRNATKEYRPDVYDVLCMNCNHAKGKLGICPHQVL